jgi:hypothetical protein
MRTNAFNFDDQQAFGTLDLTLLQGDVISCRVAPNVGSIQPGDPVKLDPLNTIGIPIVAPADASSEIFGVVVRSAIEASYTASDVVDVLVTGVMWCRAIENIQRGDNVYFVSSGSVSTNGYIYLGKALDTVSVNQNLRVLIQPIPAENVTTFKTLTGGNYTASMGNETDGGYIQGQNTATGDHGGVAMNGVYPQLYFKNTTLGEQSFRVLMELHNDGVYVSRALDGAEWVKLVEQNDFDAALQDINSRINALSGLGGALPHNDFGASPPSGTPLPATWQETLTEYACKSIWGAGGTFTWDAAEPWSSTYIIDSVTHLASGIFNSTWVRNDNDNHKFVLTNTPTTNPQVFDWADVGIDAVAQFTDTLAGVIKGDAETFGAVKSNTDGTGSVNGLANTGGGKKVLVDDGTYKTVMPQTFNSQAMNNYGLSIITNIPVDFSGYVYFELEGIYHCVSSGYENATAYTVRGVATMSGGTLTHRVFMQTGLIGQNNARLTYTNLSGLLGIFIGVNQNYRMDGFHLAKVYTSQSKGVLLPSDFYLQQNDSIGGTYFYTQNF